MWRRQTARSGHPHGRLKGGAVTSSPAHAGVRAGSPRVHPLPRVHAPLGPALPLLTPHLQGKQNQNTENVTTPDDGQRTALTTGQGCEAAVGALRQRIPASRQVRKRRACPAPRASASTASTAHRPAAPTRSAALHADAETCPLPSASSLARPRGRRPARNTRKATAYTYGGALDRNATCPDAALETGHAPSDPCGHHPGGDRPGSRASTLRAHGRDTPRGVKFREGRMAGAGLEQGGSWRLMGRRLSAGRRRWRGWPSRKDGDALAAAAPHAQGRPERQGLLCALPRSCEAEPAVLAANLPPLTSPNIM